MSVLGHFSSTSFCCAKTSLLRGTTAVRGGAEIAVFGRRWFYAEMRFSFNANLMLRGVTGGTPLSGRLRAWIAAPACNR